MNETTSADTVTAAPVDETARFRAFTALGLALAALTGGGLFASTFQWLAFRIFDESNGDRFYFTGLAIGPLLMGVAGLWLASTAMSTSDPLARPIARATLVFACLAVVGSALMMVVTFDGMYGM